MSKYVDFPTDNAGVIRVEILEADERTVRGGTRDVVESATVTFEKALEKVKPICGAIVRQLREAIEQPDEIGVEFGIKLSAEAGVILTSAATEANLKISVKWKK